jgi:1-acyl-sn-glycerol-3-phosphate acyltransferase
LSLPYIFFRTLFLIILKTFFRFEVIGSEKVPETGGVIVASNHSSYLDPLVVGCAIKNRQPTFMAKRGLFKIPLIRTFVKTFSFPIDRDRPLPSTIKEAVKRLRDGELIVMFPEGGRSKDGSLLDAKRGAAMIAATAKAKIVPAFIDGTSKALPHGAKFIRLAQIRVVFGDVIEPKGRSYQQRPKEEKGKDFHERIGNDIMEAIKSLKLKVQS